MGLNNQQIAALDTVTELDAKWRDAKKHAPQRIKALVDAEVQALRAERDFAVYHAVRVAGVPPIEFRRKHQGLHTTSPNTVLDAIQRVEVAA